MVATGRGLLQGTQASLSESGSLEAAQRVTDQGNRVDATMPPDLSTTAQSYQPYLQNGEATSTTYVSRVKNLQIEDLFRTKTCDIERDDCKLLQEGDAILPFHFHQNYSILPVTMR